MAMMFSFFTLEERLQLRAVSKAWVHAIDDERSWRSLDLTSLGAAPARGVPPALNWVMKRHGNRIHDLSTRGCHVSDDILVHIADNCPNLEVLIMDEVAPAALRVSGVPAAGSRQATAASMASAVAGAGAGASAAAGGDADVVPPRLPTLGTALSGVNYLHPRVTDRGIKALSSCRHLSRLDASGTHISDEGAAALAASHQYLSYLKIGNALLTDAGVGAVSQHATDLLYLDVSGASITDQTLKLIGTNLPRLKMLGAERCVKLTDRGIAALVDGCRELRVLVLAGCSRLTDESLGYVAQHCDVIHRLDVSFNDNITDEGLEELAECCAELDTLGVTRCGGVTGDGVVAVLTECLHLRQLSCEGVQAANLVEDVQPQCLNLTSLNMRECGAVSDTALSSLAHGCPNITALDMANDTVTGFTEVAFGILFHRLRNLRSVDLSGCGVTDEALSFLLRSRPRLAHVCLASNPGVGDTGVQMLLAGVGSHLRSLSLSSCQAVTDMSLRTIGAGAPTLTRADLSGCFRVTDRGVTDLVEGCHDLETLILGAPAPVRQRAGDAATAPVLAATPDAQGNPADANGAPSTTDAAATGAGDGASGGGCKKKRRRRRGGKGGSGGGGSSGGGGGGDGVSAALFALGDTAMLAACFACPRLNTLYMRRCTRVTDGGLGQLAATPAAQRLVNLSFAGCPNVGPSGAAAVVGDLDRLLFVSFAGCPRIAKAAKAVTAVDDAAAGGSGAAAASAAGSSKGSGGGGGGGSGGSGGKGKKGAIAAAAAATEATLADPAASLGRLRRAIRDAARRNPLVTVECALEASALGAVPVLEQENDPWKPLSVPDEDAAPEAKGGKQAKGGKAEGGGKSGKKGGDKKGKKKGKRRG